jgi:hypothetical protein
MEPSGRNQWQPLAKAPVRKAAQTSQFAAVGNPRQRPRPHGKEGVDGSSPSEGSAKAPHVGAFAYVFSRCQDA